MRKSLGFLLSLLFTNLLFAQVPINEARQAGIGTTVTIQGIVTNGDELGPIRYIQDATGALPVYSPGDFSDMTTIGDEVKVTGALKDFNNLLEIDPATSFEVLSSDNQLPDYQTVTPGGMNEDVEGERIRIEGVLFDDAGGTFSGGVYTFSADGESGQTFIRNGSPLIGTQIPLATVNLTGITSQYQDNYQILFQTADDVQVADDFYFIENPKQSDIQKTSFSLSWKTNEMGTTRLLYGTTSALDQEATLSGNNTTHTVLLENLEPATFYYAKAFSERNGNTIESGLGYFTTASESTGEIQVHFNKISDPNFSNGALPLNNTPAGIEGAIINKINTAIGTIDVAVFNNNRLPIRQALENAQDRGVQVRYVTNQGSFNSALSNPTPNFELLSVNPDALMHHKFLVIDADRTNESWVLMGSMNLTDVNELDDYNNMVFIQDQALAKAYTLEFEEIWGSDGPTPGIFTVKYGPLKEDNTPHNFMIDGVPMELYFSPSDNTTNSIVNALRTADTSLEFALLSFTRNELGTAVLDENNEGTEVRGLIENINDQGGEYQYLVDRDVDVRHHDLPGSIHHKYAIVDAKNLDSDPMVITGSHNWSTSAEVRNDENTLIIHDRNVVNIFQQEFEQRWCELTNAGNCYTSVFDNPNLKKLELTVSPNPVSNQSVLTIETDGLNEKVNLSIYDLNGRLIQGRTLPFQKNIPLEMDYFPVGQYFLVVQTSDYQGVVPLIVAE